MISSKAQKNRSRPHPRPQTGIADASPRLAAGGRARQQASQRFGARTMNRQLNEGIS